MERIVLVNEESLVEQSHSNGMEVDAVIGDTAYLQSRSMRRKV